METSALKTTVVSDSEYAEITFIEELKLIQIIWKGKVDGENYKKTFMAALDFGIDLGLCSLSKPYRGEPE